MGLGYWDYLSFQEIATNWAKEQDTFTSDEVLQELISSMILGDFEDATGASRVELLMSKTDEPEEEAWQPFTRQDFLGAIACWARTNREIQDKVIVLGGVEFPPEVLKVEDRLYACGAATGTKVLNRKKGQIWVPDPLPWEKARARVPWEELAEVPLERYPKEVRLGYLECFRIPFAAFAEWSKHRGHETPPFWRGSAKDLRTQADGATTTKKKPRRTTRSHDSQKEADERNRIEMVLTIARRKWKNPKTRPENKPMAIELARDGKINFGWETIRKILGGTYKPMKRLGIHRL